MIENLIVFNLEQFEYLVYCSKIETNIRPNEIILYLNNFEEDYYTLLDIKKILYN